MKLKGREVTELERLQVCWEDGAALLGVTGDGRSVGIRLTQSQMAVLVARLAKLMEAGYRSEETDDDNG